MGGKHIYQAIFEIGARLNASFRSAMGAAESRLKSLDRATKGLQATFGTLLASFAAYGIGSIFRKMFEGASEAAIEADNRFRKISGNLAVQLRIQKEAKSMGMTAIELGAQQTLELQKHNQELAERGVISRELLNDATAQLATFSLGPREIAKMIGPMSDMLVVQRGVNANMQDMDTFARSIGIAIKSGTAPRGLKQFGIVLGKEFKKMTMEQRYNYILAQLMKFHDQAHRAMMDPIGRIQLFQNLLHETAETLGNELIPAQADMADAWRTILEDPDIRGMLIQSVKTLAGWITTIAGMVKNDLLPVMKQLSESAAFKRLAAFTRSTASYIKMIADLAGLQARLGEPYATAREEERRKAFAGRPGPYLPDVSEYEKALEPARRVTGMEAFKVHVDSIKDFNAAQKELPPKPKLDDLNALMRDIAVTTSLTNPQMRDFAYYMTKVGDAVAAVVDYFGSLPAFHNPMYGPAPAQYGPPMATPGFASGGIVRKPTLAMIAERGPEAVVPLGRGGGIGAVHFAPHIVVHGDANPSQIVSALRNTIPDFIERFKAAQNDERRLSYEGGYA